GWYSAPNYRSTLEVLWLCLLTVFLCCWSAFHPDISQPNSTWVQQYIDRTVGLLIGVIYPEVFLYMAFFERLDARSTMQISSDVLDERWTVTHAFYANMGGFAYKRTTNEVDARGHECFEYLTAYPVNRLLMSQIDLAGFPLEKDVKAKGKADGMVRALTITQIVWVLVQSVARTIQHLPLTTLEISTLAYIPCAIFAYALWWDKPYEVSVPTLLRFKQTGVANLDLDYKETITPCQEPIAQHCKHSRHIATRTLLQRHQLFRTQKYRTYETTRQCIEVIRLSLLPVGIFGFSSAVVFLVVGAIHLAAWNFEFPSLFECWAWRVCSIVIATIVPISWLLTAVLLRVTTDQWWDGLEGKDTLEEFRTVRWISMAIQGFAVTLYSLARLYLLVEVFMGLRASPMGVYKTPEWSNFLPHV
ncbi:uncharacterized protein K460DRAFT_238274, partial [Cucurbitaria berberidis CBS 394.84]